VIELARVTGIVDAPVAAVWRLITDFANPQQLAPSIEHCSVVGEGVGAVRLVLARGLRMYEILVEADPVSRRFRYEILPQGDMPAAGLSGYAAQVVLSERAERQTHVEWSSHGNVIGDPAALNAQFEALYRGAIDQLSLILS
jgi:carbon monoxide dehydrogenase subunit G